MSDPFVNEANSPDGRPPAAGPAAFIPVRDRVRDPIPGYAMDSRFYDPVTGLPNRLTMVRRIEEALRARPHAGGNIAVISVRVNPFVAATDAHPTRPADDVLLTAIAGRLRGLVRRSDTVARLSHVEFGVLCEDLDGPAAAAEIAARLTAALGESFGTAGSSALGADLELAPGIGVAVSGPKRGAAGGRTPEQLLGEAGRRSAEMVRGPAEAGRSVVTLPDELAAARTRGQFRLDYQPILSTTNDRTTGVEALLRWTHPTRGAIPPTTFFPMAEQYGLIGMIGQWVLRQAIADRRRWQVEYPHDELNMAVTVSVHQLLSPGFTDAVAAALATIDAEPRLLTLQLRESVFINDCRRARRVLQELNGLGVRLALDHFGTGYSALSYLPRVPVEIIRIASAFVSGIVGDPASRAIVGAVVHIAHDLGMSVVAAGVESAEQRREISALSCDAYQGEYFASPLPAPRESSQFAEPMDTALHPTRIPLQQRGLVPETTSVGVSESRRDALEPPAGRAEPRAGRADPHGGGRPSRPV